MINIGTKIGQRYEVIGNIGSGGMANVYLAKDLILNREVAVKVLRFDFQNDQDAIRRFQREALAATEMVHPNIVSVYDVGEERNMQYIIMEYVRGTDLKQYIKKQANIPLETVVDIMGQILSAISLAHEHQIIHRDLKPQNVLVDEDGTVKITDFGIAIALSETSLTQTNTLLGSVHYLSPEQARGGMATRQSDIYALGIILYELLTGRVPFEGESAVSIALKHFQNEMPLVRNTNPKIPQSLENVVLKATAKETADRYKTVNDMYADLRTVLSPERANEPMFSPSAMLDETILMQPLEDVYIATGFDNTANIDMQAIENEDELATSKNKSKRGKKIILALLAIVILVSGGLFFIGQKAKGDVTIPNITGETKDEALKRLKDSNITVKAVEEVEDDKVKEGLVVKTQPPIGTSVKKNSGSVTLYVSSGQKKIKMPDYDGQDVIDAKEDLISRGFKAENIKIKEENSDDYGANKILKQTPKVSREVEPSTTEVTLYVSKGAETFSLDNMYGYSKTRVENYLNSAGLILIEGSEYNSTIPQGQVIYTSPNGGEQVKKGNYVTVIFSAGKDPSTIPSSSSSTTEHSSSSSSSSSSEVKGTDETSDPTDNTDGKTETAS